ncbi:MAG: DUF1573 domain-containing protein [Trueperaceae bacterium]|nr:MAG: DUF1573 domain-containing protein [Trueperaceae bacterium]
MHRSKRMRFGAWMAGLSLLAACNLVSDLLPAPDFTNLTPLTLNLTAVVSQTATATFSFQNTGDADLTYTISTASAFTLTPDKTSGSVSSGATETVSLTATCGSTTGTQTGTVTVTTNDTGTPSGTVTVNLTCQLSDPDFSNLSPTTLNLEAAINNSDTGTFSFQNTGNDTLTYTISTASAFTLTPNKTSGSVSSGATETISLTATCGGTAGTQAGTVTVTTNDTENPSGTVTVNLTCNASAFNINLVFDSDPAFTESRKQVFRDAATRLQGLIVGDLPGGTVPVDACGSGSGVPSTSTAVDDIEIFASIKPIDGPNGILGQAGPCWLRLASGLPLYGSMEFDSADVAALESSGQFGETILHEMMHVLGLGTIWELDFSGSGGITIDLLDYVTNPAGQNCNTATAFSTPPSFNGSNTIGEYTTLGGAGNVPVEDGGGAGTKCGHWDEETFETELMTGFLNAGVTNPLSRMTVASFQDLGYSVFINGADAYSIPPCSPTCLKVQGFDITTREILLTARGATGPDGETIYFDHTNR